MTASGFVDDGSLRDAIAALLCVKKEKVPNFSEDFGPYSVQQAVHWLQWKGFVAYIIAAAFFPSGLEEPVIAIGKNPVRLTHHAVVYNKGQLVYDPHPDKEGLIGEPEYYILVFRPVHTHPELIN